MLTGAEDADCAECAVGVGGVWARQGLEGAKIDLVFSIIAPESSESDHLLILSSISNFIRKKQKVERLRGATTIDEILFLFSKI